jgi:hypothetical protein
VSKFVQALMQADSRAFTWPVTRLELNDGSFVDLHLALEEMSQDEAPRWLLTLFDALTEPLRPAEATKE